MGKKAAAKKPGLDVLAQTIHNAGVVCGYRQGLAACAKNLRDRAVQLRGEHMALGAVLSAVKVRTSAEELEACAAAIEAQANATEGEERSRESAAQALLAAFRGGK